MWKMGLSTAALLLGCITTSAQQPATLILTNGKIVTVDDDRPEAEAIAVRGDRIVAVGTSKEIDAYRGDGTEVIDLDGKLAIPGFIEGHGHFTGFGQSLMNLDLSTAKTWDDIITQVKDAADLAPTGSWVIGRGWHQSKWDRVPESNVEGYPTHNALSEATPDHPVLLTHASGHASFANAKAMEAAGITKDTEAPDGGEILRDEKGGPTGVFRETAQGLVSRAYAASRSGMTAKERRDEVLKAIELASAETLKNGVTSFQDAGSSFGEIDVFKQLAEDGKLPVRLYVMIRQPNRLLAERLADYRMIGVGDNHLTVRAIKRSIDGALGPHGAWLLEPYEDLPGSSGLNTASVESVTETARLALEQDYQLCVHAIGDRANREVLDIFEKAMPPEDHRWRIEHAQHLHPDDIPRFAELGVIASMQGIHCTSDAVYVLQRLGDRRAMQGAYVWQSLLMSGAVVTNGTDVPVEKIDPIASFYATVTRRVNDKVVFFREQRMTREEALKSYTLSCAYAAFEEDIKGSLTPGKLADITVLSKDIMTVPEEEIPDAEVLYTIVGGKVLYRKDG